METIADWRARKHRELTILASPLDDAPHAAPPADPDEVVTRKLRVRSALLARAALALPDLVETNRLDGDHLIHDDWDLSWRYQRFDLEIRGPLPYPGLMDDRASVWTTGWTSSGMGAIASVLLALPGLEGSIRWVGRSDVYFETLDVARSLARLDPVQVEDAGAVAAAARAARAHPRDVVVWWADSFGRRDPMDDREALAVVDHLVLDTTCYAATSPRVRALVDAALEQGVPVTLVRSHVKLDFLGVEYGRLGSMVHLVTPFVPKERFNRYRALAAAASHARRGVGATAVPLHLPPLLADAAFHAANSERVAAIEVATAQVAQRLAARCADGPHAVRTYHHGLFFALGVFHRHAGPASVRAAAEALVATLRTRGLAAAFANSFGFDFVAVAPFRHPVTGDDELRIAVPDWPEPWLDTLVDALAAWTGGIPDPLTR